MRRTLAAVMPIVALTAAAACTGSAARTSAPAAPGARAATSSPTPGGRESYVAQVGALCTTLQSQETAIVASFPPHFPVAVFLVDTTKMWPLLDAFDAKVAALAVSPADKAAAAAFASYVKESAASRRLRVAAAQRGQTDYDAEYDRQVKLYANDPVLDAIDNLGFSNACHYR